MPNAPLALQAASDQRFIWRREKSSIRQVSQEWDSPARFWDTSYCNVDPLPRPSLCEGGLTDRAEGKAQTVGHSGFKRMYSFRIVAAFVG
jgi:hypothetical protein